MKSAAVTFTIGAFAEIAGVHVETIRFYQRKGLLPKPDRPSVGVRRYGQADLRRMRFVKMAQQLGFSLDEIAALLRLEAGTQCDEARLLASHKLGDVRNALAELARMQSVLSKLLRACRSRRDCASCPLIASLQGDGDGADGFPSAG